MKKVLVFGYFHAMSCVSPLRFQPTAGLKTRPTSQPRIGYFQKKNLMSKLIVVAIAIILLLLCNFGESGYVVYRAYWGALNSGRTSCDGQPDNIGVYTSSSISSDDCTNVYLEDCTFRANGNYYKDICIYQQFGVSTTDTTLRPPFSGSWVEVRRISTFSQCSISSAGSLVGWFANGVCARSSAYSSYNSRVYFNSSSAEVRMNCNPDRCETTCVDIGNTFTGFGVTQACISGLYLRPVTGTYIPPNNPSINTPTNNSVAGIAVAIVIPIVLTVCFFCAVCVGCVVVCCVIDSKQKKKSKPIVVVTTSEQQSVVQPIMVTQQQTTVNHVPLVIPNVVPSYYVNSGGAQQYQSSKFTISNVVQPQPTQQMYFNQAPQYQQPQQQMVYETPMMTSDFQSTFVEAQQQQTAMQYDYTPYAPPMELQQQQTVMQQNYTSAHIYTNLESQLQQIQEPLPEVILEETLQQFISKCVQLLQQHSNISQMESEAMVADVLQKLHKESITAVLTLKMMSQEDFVRLEIPLELISIMIQQLHSGNENTFY